MFDTLLASSIAPRPQAGFGLIALLLHVAIVLGAIGATETSRAIVRTAARDTIRLYLTRPRMLEPDRSSPSTPPMGAPAIPAPPPVQEGPPQIPAIQLSRSTGSSMDVGAFASMLGASDSARSARELGAAPAVLSVTEVDGLPRLTGQLRPRYPEALRRTGVSGQVMLEYVVESTGRVDSSSVRVLLSSNPEFTDAVREALRSVRFLPGLRSGQPVAVVVRQTIRFEIR